MFELKEESQSLILPNEREKNYSNDSAVSVEFLITEDVHPQQMIKSFIFL